MVFPRAFPDNMPYVIELYTAYIYLSMVCSLNEYSLANTNGGDYNRGTVASDQFGMCSK